MRKVIFKGSDISPSEDHSGGWGGLGEDEEMPLPPFISLLKLSLITVLENGSYCRELLY